MKNAKNVSPVKNRRINNKNSSYRKRRQPSEEKLLFYFKIGFLQFCFFFPFAIQTPCGFGPQTEKQEETLEGSRNRYQQMLQLTGLFNLFLSFFVLTFFCFNGYKKILNFWMLQLRQLLAICVKVVQLQI